ncbi:hypothetical protein NDU88_002145 [Pleurodeles waltl]|uniref:Uncharacterized protein n=1 Tax=Pleurodeles waltl TaxID=8319 RepID=A0AAV7U8V1_PLEWA|nr:hypothetical protein NDU88_002145 [Pleurodeles waltl]
MSKTLCSASALLADYHGGTAVAEFGDKAAESTDNDEEPGPSVTEPSLASIQEMIQAAVAGAFQEREQQSSPKKPRLDVALANSDTEKDEGKGRCVQGPEFKKVLQHIRHNIKFPDVVPLDESGDFFSQYHKKNPESLFLHLPIMNGLESERKADKHVFPRFLAKRYPSHDFADTFSAAVKVDSLTAGLASKVEMHEQEFCMVLQDHRFLLNLKKTCLLLTQELTFTGAHFRTLEGKVFVPMERRQTLMTEVQELLLLSMAPVKQWLHL